MTAKDDLNFVYEQARRFVSARPWERLGHASLYLDLKVDVGQQPADPNSGSVHTIFECRSQAN
jgi:hypothetical protein